MILAEELKRPVNRRIASMKESVQSLLPCRHLPCTSSPKAELGFGGSLTHKRKAGQIVCNRLYRSWESMATRLARFRQ
jgi:hypothetical protein